MLLWHPHQKLWSWALVGAIESAFASRPRLARAVVYLVVTLDSMLLLGAVIIRRTRLLGFRTLVPSRFDRGTERVLYVDCGLHDQGLELVWLLKWCARRYEVQALAFEAATRQLALARVNLSDLPELDLRGQALVGPQHSEATVTLFIDARGRQGESRGDTLFAQRPRGASEVVPAVRLSDVLRSDYGDHAGPVVLRMNIEGAEMYVIEDLIDAGLANRVDGYHGMWDDLSKIDPGLDLRFRELLRTHRIKPITFNDRDLRYVLRRFAIRADVTTSIRNGVRRGPRSIGGVRPAA